MKARLLTVIFLAVVWIGLIGKINLANFIDGLLLGFFIVLLAKHQFKTTPNLSKLPKAILFILFFFYEVIKANLKVAYDIITPKHHMKPGIIAFPLDAQSDIEITFLANVVTLTPGTLALDVSKDKTIMYIHAMYIDNVEDFILKTKINFEKPLLEILR